MIKEAECHEKAIDLERKKRIIYEWKPPPKDWLKCDIASAWNKSNQQSGASWVIRNNEDKVVMHAKRFFVGIHSKFEAFFESYSWTLESMKNLHLNAIIFASEDSDIIGALSKPSAWPSLRFQSSTLLNCLQDIVDWKVHFNSHQHIFGAKLIARSVIKKDLYQSYIAVGFIFLFKPLLD